MIPMKAPTHRAINPSSVAALSLALAAAVLSGCRGERTDDPPRQFFPDLDNQPKYKAQEESAFFEDGRAMRLPVVGTVPFGAKPFAVRFEGKDFTHRDEYLRDDPRVYTGMELRRDATGKMAEAYLDRIPVVVDEEIRALGEKKYNIFCISCHGGTGGGDGTVGKKWSYPLPNFHTEQYQYGGEKGQDGYLFHTALNGVPNVGENVPYPYKMKGYRGKISEKEAWAIVAYIRALQVSQGAPLDVVPERERLELERRRGASPAANAAPASEPIAAVSKEVAR